MNHEVDARAPWRRRLHEVIFEADTPSGKVFDICLLAAIVAGVLVVMLETLEDPPAPGVLYGVEWVITGLFTVEYLLRLACVRRPLAYARSFFGIVDLVSIMPSYLDLVLSNDVRTLLVVRALRLLRVFRILKLGHLLSEATFLRRALVQSRAKIAVFLSAVLVVVVIMGTAMYIVETETNPGFASIPQACYWAVVTMTTVGYGDIAPMTAFGKFLATVIMVCGYSFIIIPTGIISTELALAVRGQITTQNCPSCTAEGHDVDAVHCKFCGAKL